jgi:hypothetical protein
MSDEQLPELSGLENEGLFNVLDAHRDLTDAKVQLESLLDASDSLESLIAHLESHEVVTPGHKAAIQVSFENLVVGTGMSIADILPSLETHQEGMVSTESLKNIARDLWKRIVSMVLVLIQFVKDFWNTIATYRGQLRHSAEHIAKHGAVRRSNSIKNPDVLLGVEIKSFLLGSLVIKDPDTVIRAISTALEQYKIVTSNYGPSMIELGKKFEQRLASGTTGRDLLVEVCNVFDASPVSSISSKMRAMAFHDPRFGRRLLLAAPPVIGGWTMFFLTLEKEARDGFESNPINFAQALRTTGVKFAMSNLNNSNAMSGTVKTATGQQVEIIAKRVLEILDTIDAQERAMAFNKIESQIKNVLRAGERFQNSLGSSDSFDQSTIRFVRSYATMAIGPVDQMTTNLLTVSRNLLTYARKSLQNQ